jgi:hypothetical protein
MGAFDTNYDKNRIIEIILYHIFAVGKQNNCEVSIGVLEKQNLTAPDTVRVKIDDARNH